MPIGINSPARNLFLLGSSGSQLVSNFFKLIDQTSATEDRYKSTSIIYNEVDEKYLLSGTARNINVSPNKEFGWLEKRDEAGTDDWNVRVESPQSGVNTYLWDMDLDINDNLTVVGITGTTPWIAKYSNGGVIDWQSTSNTGDLQYFGVTSDSNGQYYACGTTLYNNGSQAFVEKFDANGNPGWGKSAFSLGREVFLKKIAANSRGEVVAVGYVEDDNYIYKGYIVKIDTNTGEVLWDRTLSYYGENIFLDDVKIDSKDQIYILGNGGGSPYSEQFVIKYTGEGNLLWQTQTNKPSTSTTALYPEALTVNDVTESVTTIARLNDSTYKLLLSNYDRKGKLIWRRKISQGSIGTWWPEIDNEGAFIYFVFKPQVNSSDSKYTYGKLSATGNGLGDFQYNDGNTSTLIDYEYIGSGELQNDVIGKLSDGSVRNDTSDLITYPFSANTLVFDDLATQVSNKKRQLGSADSFEYSGSPAIRPADFQELNLLGDVYSGGGNWLDQSGKGNDGVVNGATWNASGYWVFDRTIESHINLGNVLGTTEPFTLETWVNPDNLTGSQNILSKGNNFWLHREVTTNQYRVKYQNASSTRFEAISTTLAVVGTWSHLVGSWDGSNLRIYINGTLEGTTPTTEIPATNNLPLAVGDYFTGLTTTADGFSGKIGEVRIYPRALTAAQVFQNYNATKSKYINEAPDTAPKIGPGIVYDSNLLLNYDFGNKACFDFKHNYINYNTKQLPITGVQDNNGTVDGYTVTRGGIISNTEVAPDGSRTAVLFREADGIEGSARIFTAGWRQPDFDGQVHYFSTYVKKAGSRYVYVALYQSDDGNDYDGVKFDFDTETLIDADPSANWDRGFTNVGNGWYRIWIGFPINAGTTIYVTVGSDDNGTLEGLTSTLVTRNIDAFYTWGWQVTKDALTDTYINSGTVYSSGKLDPPTTVKNLSSSSYTGPISGGSAFNSDGYFEFDGVNQSIDLTYTAHQTTAGTLEVWYKSADTNTTTLGGIIGVGGNSNTGASRIMRLFSREVRFLNYGPTGTVDWDTGVFLNDNTWYHLVYTWDGTAANFYRNNTGISTTLTGLVTPQGDQLRIARSPFFGNYLLADIGEARHYNRALTATEVSQNFNATRSKYGV